MFIGADWFFAGVFVASVLFYMDRRTHRFLESRRRQLIARGRGSRVPAWPSEPWYRN